MFNRKKYVKKWRKRNPERVKEWQRKWRKHNLEHARQLDRESYARRRTKILIAVKKWRKRNHKRVKQWDSKWRKRNQEYINSKRRERWHSNPDKYRKSQRERKWKAKTTTEKETVQWLYENRNKLRQLRKLHKEGTFGQSQLRRLPLKDWSRLLSAATSPQQKKRK